MKLVKINENTNMFQVDPNELRKNYRTSTKFQVGDSKTISKLLK